MDINSVIDIYRWCEDFIKEMKPYFTPHERNIAYTHIDATIWEFARRLKLSQADYAKLVLEKQYTFKALYDYIF